MVGAGTLTAVETKTNQETEFPTPWQRIWEEKLSATKPASPCPWEDVSNARGGRPTSSRWSPFILRSAGGLMSPTATSEATPPGPPRQGGFLLRWVRADMGHREVKRYRNQLRRLTIGWYTTELYCTITDRWLHPWSTGDAKKKKNKNHFASSVKPDGIGTVILTLSVVSTRRLQYLASAMSQNKYIILSRVWNYQNVKVLKKLSHVKKIKKDGFFFFLIILYRIFRWWDQPI